MNLSLRKTLEYCLIILIFLIISIVYYSPVIDGKVLKTNDTAVWKASASEIFEHREKYGEEPLWTNAMFGGMPAFHISCNYPGNLLKPVLRLIQVFKIPIAALFLTLTGFFILLLVFDVKPWLAMVGAIAYAFCSYNFIILAAGHNTKAYAIAYMAPTIAGVILTIRRSRLIGLSLTAIFLTFEILSNHFQVTYYAAMLLLIFGVSELIYYIREKKIKSLLISLGLLLIVAILSVGSNFGSLYTTYEYSKFTTRGGSNLSSVASSEEGLDKEYATRWSLGIDETMTLLIPNFKGGATEPFDRDSETFKMLRSYNATNLQQYFMSYWGKQPGTSPVYAGAIVIFLFILAIFIIEGRDKWWLLVATVLSIMLAWGKNFMPLTNVFFDYFPGYNKFRAVSMILVIAGFTIPLLGILGLKEIFQGNTDRRKLLKGLKWATVITGGVCLFFAVLPGAAGNFSSQNDLAILSQLNISNDIQAAFERAFAADRRSLLQADAFRSFILISLSALLLWAYISKKLESKYAFGLLAILILMDMWPVDKRFLNNDMFSIKKTNDQPYNMTAADKEILRDTTPYYRVLNLTVSTFNDASTSNYHKSIGGYHGAKLQRYQELIEHGISSDINRFITTARQAQTFNDFSAVLASTNTLNMLNTKYIIIDPNSSPVLNEHCLGNAWLVDKVNLVEDSDEEISQIGSFSPSTELLVDKKYADLLHNKDSFSKNGKIELIDYKANELRYQYSSVDESLVVFSEIYYPAGWKAYIDDVESEYFRADYLLRAMVVPGGSHEIRFRFDPHSYRVGNQVSLVSSLLIILMIAGLIFIKFRKPGAASNEKIY